MVNWTSTTDMLSGLGDVAASMVDLVIAFFPLVLLGAVLGLVRGLFEGFINMFSSGFR